MEADSPGGQRRKIAFFKRGLFSHCNLPMTTQLRRVYPECELEIIDIHDELIRQRKLVIAINLFLVVARYWRQLLGRRQSLRQCFYRTPFIFHEIRKLARSMIEPRKNEYAFTFQTQSLYDCSTPGLPHFIYSDHSHLANLMYPAFSRSELFPRVWIDLERETYHRARHVFVMSEHVRRSLIDQYGCDPKRAATVSGGSNVDPTPVPLQNDDYRNQTVVFVGIEWERKGGPTLVEAFKRVRERLPNSRLVIIGSSPSLNSPGIEVLGRVPREEVKARLAKASVFCMPTRIEPFGVAVVEAFFHELPVVATNIGAMPGLVCDGENGRLVPPDDPQALAEALIELLSDPEKCRRFGRAGREQVSKRCSWEIAAERIRAFIDEDLAADQAKNPAEPEKLAAA